MNKVGRPRKYPEWAREEAKKNNISWNVVINRVQIGWDLKQAVKEPLTNHGKKKYPDWVYEKLKENGVSRNTFHQRLYRGLSLEEAIKPLERDRGKYKKRENKETKKHDMYYYMIVTNDKYELPLMVCDSARELADYLGIQTPTVYKSAILEFKTSTKGRKIRRVKKI